MTDVSKQRLTGPQTTLTNIVKAAALASSYVTETEWNNFNEYAAWRNPFYLVYRDYQNGYFASLLTDLKCYYKLDGNSNDSLGALNGADNAVTYNASYGKISQGVQNNSAAGYIEIGATTDFSFIQNTGVFSINFWYKQIVNTNTGLFMGNTALSSEKGFWFQCNNGGVLLFRIQNGSSLTFDCAAIQTSNLIPSNVYKMITVCGDGTRLYLYINNVLCSSSPFLNFATGNSNNKLRLLYVTGTGGSTTINMDEVGFWTKCLSLGEIAALYNGGTGLSYPF